MPKSKHIFHNDLGNKASIIKWSGKRNRKKLLASIIPPLIVSITFSLSVRAEENADYTLDPVLVTAESLRAEEPVYSRLAVPESAKATTDTFTRKDIEEMHPRDVVEVIEKGLGVTTTFQGRKNLNFLKIRGNGSLGLIVDGIYIPQTQSGRELANFPLELVESIKIVRNSSMLTLGPVTAFSSTQGAPNAGFIVITTRKPAKLENELKISYGTLNTQHLNIFHGERFKNYYFVADYNRNKTDGKDNWYNDSSADSLYLKTGFVRKGLASNFSLHYDWAHRNFQRSMTETGALDDAKWGYDPLNTFMLSFDMTRFWDKQNTTGMSFGYSEINDYMRPNSFTKPNSTVQNEEDYLREFNLWHTIIAGKNTLKFGAQAILWHNPTGELYYYGKERQEELYGYYIYDEHRVNEKLTLDAGVRIDRKHITKGIDKYNPSGTSTQLINDMWMNDAVSYALGAVYKIDSVYTLFTRVSHSKQPTDKFMDTVNDKELDPEKRYKYEVGMVAKCNKNFHATLTAFYNNVDNYKIVDHTVKVGADTINVYDVADVGQRGLELGFNGRLSRALTYDLGYSYMTSDNDADNATMPHNTYTLRINHQGKAFDTNVTVRRVGSYTSAVTAGVPLGGYTQVDLNFSKMLARNTKLTVFGRNITDQQYASMTKGGGYYYDVGATYGVEWSKKY